MVAETSKKHYFFAVAVLTTATLLSGCAAVIVGGAAATTAVVATDRRTTGEQVEDRAIELKAESRLRSLLGENARVNSLSYAGVLLLTGDVPTANDKQRAGESAATVEKVKKVVNELRVGDITPISVRSNDTWLTSKVKTALINTKEVPSRTIALTTERGVVYLMGRVTHTEAQRAAIVASEVGGINKVVNGFEIISAASLKPAAAPIQESPAPDPSTATQSNPNDTQAMPVN